MCSERREDGPSSLKESAKATNFREGPKGEVRRIYIPRTSVNKGKKEGRGCYASVLASPSRAGSGRRPLLVLLLLASQEVARGPAHGVGSEKAPLRHMGE